MDLFMAFNQVGVTVLIATHDIPLIKQLDKRIIQLSHGQLNPGISSSTDQFTVNS
jgi:cell division transport system ATP-binding protein